MIGTIQGVVAQTTVTRGAEGAKKYARMLRDGTLAFADFMLVAELEGLVKVADAGVAVTGITTAGAYAANAADFGLAVPVNYTVMIVAVEVITGAMADDKDEDIVFMTSEVVLAGTTGTAITPVNKFGGASGPGTGSQCTCYMAFDGGGGTDTSGGARAYAFWRERHENGAAPVAADSEGTTNCRYAWTAPKKGLPAIVAGAGSVQGHIASSAAIAGCHVRVEWIEMPTSWLR